MTNEIRRIPLLFACIGCPSSKVNADRELSVGDEVLLFVPVWRVAAPHTPLHDSHSQMERRYSQEALAQALYEQYQLKIVKDGPIPGLLGDNGEETWLHFPQEGPALSPAIRVGHTARCQDLCGYDIGEQWDAMRCPEVGCQVELWQLGWHLQFLRWVVDDLRYNQMRDGFAHELRLAYYRIVRGPWRIEQSDIPADAKAYEGYNLANVAKYLHDVTS